MPSCSAIIYRKRLSGLILAATAVVLATLAGTLRAEPGVPRVEAFWEDSVAVIRPEVLNPFDDPARRALRSGVPVVVEVEIRFARTGFARTELIPIKVEFDVWTGWYRIHTPLSPFAIDEFETVLLFFRDNLILPFSSEALPGDRPWFVKVRAGSRIAEDGGGYGVRENLGGIELFFYELFGGGRDLGEWSDVVRLPESPLWRGW